VHGIVEDDPMKAQDSHSKAARDSAWNFHSAALPSRLLPDGKTWRVHVAQRLHVDDPSGRILKQGGWVHLKLPMHYNPKRIVLTPLGNPDPREKEGELIWPSRMTEAFVQRRDKGMGPHNVAAQEEQDPTAIEGGIIKRAWLKRRWNKHTLPERFDVEWISADLAFKDTNDPVAIQHWGYVDGTFYLIRRIAELMDFVKSEQALLAMAARSSQSITMAKVVEDKANGSAMISRMRRKVPGFEAFQPQGDKLVRLNAVSPVFASQAVVIPDETEDPTIEDYVEQLCGFPDVLHDDEADATSQAILHFQANHDSLLQLAFGDVGMGTGEMHDPSEKIRPFNFDIGVGGDRDR
jgi:predicted phage terminase large subunit-like protein